MSHLRRGWRRRRFGLKTAAQRSGSISISSAAARSQSNKRRGEEEVEEEGRGGGERRRGKEEERGGGEKRRGEEECKRIRGQGDRFLRGGRRMKRTKDQGRVRRDRWTGEGVRERESSGE
eukprot:768336-Hanusia_phi.AAC.4